VPYDARREHDEDQAADDREVNLKIEPAHGFARVTSAPWRTHIPRRGR
jgi:hypothetical protein